MSGYETLLLFHLLAAFALLTGIVILVPVMLRADVGDVARARLLRLSMILSGSGAGLTLIFGLLLIADRDYGFFDAWIIVSLVLWLVANAFGARIRTADDRLAFWVTTIGALAILVLMIFKPGA